jgi:predicted phage-related endonuclease
MGNIAVPDEATWLTIRDQHVGGSEIASLFYRWRYTDGTEAVHHLYEQPPEGAQFIECLSSHTTGYRLWQQKAGRLMPDDLSSVERVQAGVHLEPALAAWAKERWNWSALRKVRRYTTHPTVKGWGASLDYELNEPGRPPVEFKNVDFLVFRDQWVAEDNEIVMPPLPYVLQLQHQIGAVEAEHGWVVACVAGNRLLRGRIERHEGTQARIAQAIEAFWLGVANNIEPTWVADYDTVADAYRFGTPGTTIDLTADAELPGLCARYSEAKSRLEVAETEVDSLKAQIGSRLKDAPKASAAGYAISWPVIERKEKVVPERIQKALTYRGALTVKEVK